MVMRILAPRRPQPVPITGTFVSLTVHAALVAAVVGGDASSLGRGDAVPRAGAGTGPSGGEHLHWVGVRPGSGDAAARPRPGARPPIAYVVPGHGGVRAEVATAHTPGHDGPRRSARRPVGTAEPLLEAAADRASAGRPTVERASRTRSILRRTPLPDLKLSDPEVTRLVAGVLASAPDLVRRVSRSDEFVPTLAADAMSDLLAQTGALALLRPDVHMRELPIPLVGNPPPAYPTVLARSHVGGQVVVEFRIDSTGVVDLASLRVVQSTNALFTDAVRGVLPQLRFLPAQLGEHSVGVTVRQPFLFTVRAGV